MSQLLFPRKEAWTEDLVRRAAGELGLVSDRVGQLAFLNYCIAHGKQGGGQRDTRRQQLVRAMRRMEERGRLPFRIEGDYFVFA